MLNKTNSKKCEFCAKEEITPCFRCNKLVCEDHLNIIGSEGYCPNCAKKIERKERNKSILIKVLVILIIVVIVFSSMLGGLLIIPSI